MKYAALLLSVLVLGACSTSSNYVLTAYTTKGKVLNKKVELASNEAGIPTMRDTLCKTYPNAVIRIHKRISGQEATEYSPYSCR
ncbi:MAG: hypothetical protein Q4A84_02465 [Neisseria sp.]|uniref:hypothetical protein n=1 Tax=Neisseria sp. TaxID=192066 RepID=UPI0026DD2B0C|nr:hypothetical protein [Neisseria sp.]MDO4640556.1 hypothetical protein [Neisseria sp.]